MNKKERLAELQAMIQNVHNQPRLSDSIKENAKFVFVFGSEIAVIKVF